MEDVEYKEAIQAMANLDMIDKSVDEAIDSDDEDYIMQTIRRDYLSDSTVTIHLIGARSGENLGAYEQRFIKRELQASLYDGPENPRSGILGVVLPCTYSVVYKGSLQCGTCAGIHNVINISDQTAVREFSYNYYIPNNKCSHSEDERYCVLATWDDFRNAPERFIEMAFAKREHDIATKVRVRP